MSKNVLTKGDLTKIKQALYELAESEPFLTLLREIGADVEEMSQLRENARKNLLKYQAFINGEAK